VVSVCVNAVRAFSPLQLLLDVLPQEASLTDHFKELMREQSRIHTQLTEAAVREAEHVLAADTAKAHLQVKMPLNIPFPYPVAFAHLLQSAGEGKEALSYVYRECLVISTTLAPVVRLLRPSNMHVSSTHMVKLRQSRPTVLGTQGVMYVTVLHL
jgi:hypothetical protein